MQASVFEEFYKIPFIYSLSVRGVDVGHSVCVCIQVPTEASRRYLILRSRITCSPKLSCSLEEQ